MSEKRPEITQLDRWTLIRRLAAAVLVSISATASLMLVVQHFGGLQLPGCGVDSGCAELSAGDWGKIAGWPVSFLGLAYFVGLLLVCLIPPWSGFPSSIRWLVRIGVVASIGFLVIMFLEKSFCLYCVIAHTANFAFWLIVEWTPSLSQRRAAPGLAFLASAFVISTLLAVVQGQVQHAIALEKKDDFRRSMREIVRSSRQRTEDPMADPSKGFTGHYREGPEKAAIRLVVYSDYQCRFCRLIEQKLREMLPQYESLSLSSKHFPMCHECNPAVKYERLHENACRAASAAEAAGILAGNEGFWKVHWWLFDQRGMFTDQQLREALPSLGFEDVDKFMSTMNGATVKSRILQDVEEAISYGLTSTPSVFINGVELGGMEDETTVEQAILELSKQGLPPRTAAYDKPRSDVARLIGLWEKGESIEIPIGQPRWTHGRADAPIQMVVFMDYREPYAPQVSQAMIDTALQRDDVWLELYHFPLTKKLNIVLDEAEPDDFALSFDTARLVEAAGLMGGQDAFWKMHQWILRNREDFSLEAGLEVASSMGLDAEQLAAKINSPDVQEGITRDVRMAATIETKWAPRVFVNGREINNSASSADLATAIFDKVAKGE